MAAREARVCVAIYHGALLLVRHPASRVHPWYFFRFTNDPFLQLGGLHSNGYISDLFAKAFATEGMKAYVELIQRKERELGTDMLTHQKVRTSLLHL